MQSLVRLSSQDVSVITVSPVVCVLNEPLPGTCTHQMLGKQKKKCERAVRGVLRIGVKGFKCEGRKLYYYDDIVQYTGAHPRPLPEG